MNDKGKVRRGAPDRLAEPGSERRGAVRPGRSAQASRSLFYYALTPALSAANALTGLLLPALLGPVEFGRYALAVTLFQYGIILDLGLAQLIDRRIPVLLSRAAHQELEGFVSRVLWLRIYIAALELAAGSALLAWFGIHGGLMFDVPTGVLSLAAGLLFMLGLGPGAVYRASSRRREFALLNASLGVVLAVARPVGVILGGVSGCFLGLTLGYGAVLAAAQVRMPLAWAGRPALSSVLPILRQSLPLFVATFIYAFYLTANRWVVAQLASPIELGRFTFGANVVYLIGGSLGALVQFYYPRVATRFAAGRDYSVSSFLVRDICALILVAAFLAALGIVIGPYFVIWLYPKFAAGVPALRVLLVSLPGILAASWLMPLLLSTTARPWLEAIIIYPVALAVLVAITVVGYRAGGIHGAGYGAVGGTIPMLCLQLLALHLNRLLSLRHAALLFLFSTVVSLSLLAVTA